MLLPDELVEGAGAHPGGQGQRGFAGAPEAFFAGPRIGWGLPEFLGHQGAHRLGTVDLLRAAVSSLRITRSLARRRDRPEIGRGIPLQSRVQRLHLFCNGIVDPMCSTIPVSYT